MKGFLIVLGVLALIGLYAVSHTTGLIIQAPCNINNLGLA